MLYTYHMTSYAIEVEFMCVYLLTMEINKIRRVHKLLQKSFQLIVKYHNLISNLQPNWISHDSRVVGQHNLACGTANPKFRVKIPPRQKDVPLANVLRNCEFVTLAIGSGNFVIKRANLQFDCLNISRMFEVAGSAEWNALPEPVRRFSR